MPTGWWQNSPQPPAQPHHPVPAALRGPASTAGRGLSSFLVLTKAQLGWRGRRKHGETPTGCREGTAGRSRGLLRLGCLRCLAPPARPPGKMPQGGVHSHQPPLQKFWSQNPLSVCSHLYVSLGKWKAARRRFLNVEAPSRAEGPEVPAARWAPSTRTRPRCSCERCQGWSWVCLPAELPPRGPTPRSASN